MNQPQSCLLYTSGAPNVGPILSVPAQDQVVDFVALIGGDPLQPGDPPGGYFEPSTAPSIYQLYKYNLILISPGVVESAVLDPNDGNSEYITTFKTLDGMIVTKIESANTQISAEIYSYYYCFQQ